MPCLQALLKVLDAAASAVRLQGAKAALTTQRLQLWRDSLHGFKRLAECVQGEQQQLGMKMTLFEDQLVEAEQGLAELEESFLSGDDC